MQIFADLKTLYLVFALIRVVQAVGLAFVWRVQHSFSPARNWATGSLLIALAAVLLVVRVDPTPLWLIVLTNLSVFSGIVIFNGGLIEAVGGAPPWRAGLVLAAAGTIGAVIFAVAVPSMSARFAIFAFVITASDAVAIRAVLKAPAGPLRLTQRFVAFLLLWESAVTILRAADSVAIGLTSPSQSTPMQLVFVLSVIIITFLMALALSTLTNQRANALLEATLAHMHQGVAMFDSAQKLIICNERYAEMYSLSLKQVKSGTPLREIVQHRIAKGIFAGATPQDYIEERTAPVLGASANLQHLSDGRSIAISRRTVEGGGWVTTHDDVTDRQRIEAKIAHMAHHDALTDLANRLLFAEKMSEALSRLRRYNDTFAVLVLDLDRFKTVNDSLGHPVGDALLKIVAERLRGCIRDTDTVARFGGDEFAVLQTGGRIQREAIVVLAARILEVVAAPYEIDGHQILIGTSIGIVLAPDDGTDPEQLMRNADLALYRAKSEGRNGYRFYDLDMDAAARERHALELDLRNAGIAEQFLLEYQPVFAAQTRAIVAAEALVRWNHPQRGRIMPGDFISIAEESGLIGELGEWILREACAQARLWPQHVNVSVNLSPAQFAKRDLVGMISRVLGESGLPPNRLELEITESVLLHQTSENLAVLRGLKSLGVSIALDDFGTGYASLTNLLVFPFDKIKIDKSFISGLANRADCAAVVCAITGLARSLGMVTTAEGVETEEQFELLCAAGCSLVQGYHFARPLPAATLSTLLQDALPGAGQGRTLRKAG